MGPPAPAETIMMKPSSLLRGLVFSLLLGAAPLLSQCGGEANLPTEAGTPPHLEPVKLYLDVAADGLRVVGSPGAVAPAGASVRVTNPRTGVSVIATAAADGALDVIIAGEIGDELELSVTSGGQEASDRISFSAIGSRTDFSGLPCDVMEIALRETLLDVFEAADPTCRFDIECLSIPMGAVSCFLSCRDGMVSRAALQDVTAQSEQQTASLCQALSACDRPMPSCPEEDDSLRTTACQDGRCVRVSPVRLTCSDYFDPAGVRRGELLDAANEACTEDADCALANIGVRCLNDCERTFDSVARSEVASLEASVQEVDRFYCEPAFALGCEVPPGDCQPPTGIATAVCEAGACAVRYVE